MWVHSMSMTGAAARAGAGSRAAVSQACNDATTRASAPLSLEKEAIVNDILGGDKEKRRGHMANSETAAEVKQVIGR